MSSSNSKNFITLCCSDNEMFEIEEVVALQSQTIKHMIEDGCADNIIPLPNVQGKIFAKVVDYCNKHYTTDENNKDNDLKKWETQFLDVELPTLINLMHAANYLSVKGLLDLTGKAVADIIKKHSPEEIREIFKIKNDFTPQEELAVRRENQWALDDHEKKKKKKKKKDT